MLPQLHGLCSVEKVAEEVVRTWSITPLKLYKF